MKNDIKTIAALFCLGCLGLYVKRKNDKKGISGIRYEMPGSEREVATNINIAMDKLFSGKAGNFNGDIYADGQGEIYISETLKQATGLPTFLIYKWQIKKALTELKRIERALIWSEYMDDTFSFVSKKQMLKNVYDNYIEQIENDGATTHEQGYLYALYYMANGGKYIWYDKGLQRGVKTELLATNRNNKGKADRKAKAKILNDKNGISPEIQAENIRSYRRDGDDQYIKNGILEAINDVNTPNEALDKLQFSLTTIDLHENSVPF